jgi:hypothetical protein
MVHVIANYSKIFIFMILLSSVQRKTITPQMFLFVALIILLGTCPSLGNPTLWNPKPIIIWKNTLTPGPNYDFLTCLATWGDYVFVGGDHNLTTTDTEFIIYKLRKSNGELIQTWKLNPTSKMDRLYDCLVIGNYLYAVGASPTGSLGTYELVFFKLDPTDLSKYVKKTFDLDWFSDDFPTSLSTDGYYIYISGFYGLIPTSGSALKLDLDLNVIKYNRYPEANFNYAIGVNPKTKDIWIISDTYLIVADSDLLTKKTILLPRPAPSWFYASLIFDMDGNGYISYGNRIFKYDKDLNLIKMVSLSNFISKLIFIFDYIYATSGYKLFILNRQLEIVTEISLDGYNYRGASFDSSNLYLAGWRDAGMGDVDWLVYRIDPLVSRIHLVVRGADDGIYYRWMIANWSQWVKLPGLTIDTPALIESKDKIIILVRGRDNQLWLSSIRIPTGEFLGWQNLPGRTPSRPTITVDTNNSKLYIVVRGMDNGIYYRELSSSSWVKLPGSTIDAPSAVVLNGKLHIVVRGSDGTSIYHGQLDLLSGKWLGWIKLTGSTPSAPSLTTNGTHLFLAVRGSNNRIYVKVWSNAWGSWEMIPTGTTQSPPAIAWYNGKLYVFVRGGDNGIYYCWKTESGQWSAWTKLSGTTPSAPAIYPPP